MGLTGNALADFLIAVVGLGLMVGLFFLAIDRLAPDDFSKKVAKWAVGGFALLLVLVALKAVLFGGAGALVLSPLGLLLFAVGILVALAVLYIATLAIDYFAPEAWRVHLKYLLGVIVLIALLGWAAHVLFDYSLVRRGAAVNPPFRAGAVAGPTPAALPGRAAADLRRVLTSA